MTKGDKKGARSGLLVAAEALDAELRKYEGLAEGIARAPLNSQKALERMAASLTEVTDADERLGARARELIEAITAARERQQAQAEAVAARARELQGRAEAWKGLMQRYKGVAQEAVDVNGMIREAAAGASGQDGVPAAFEEAYERLGKLAETAQGLAQGAQAEGFVDVARDADAVRQQLLAARNKLGMLRKKG